MNVAVNASTLRVAGGLSVGLNFIRSLSEIDSKEQWDCLVPGNCGYEPLETSAVRMHPIPRFLNKSLLRPYTDNIWLPGRINTFRPDVVFSMGNFAIPGNSPQLLLFHWPYAVYPESQVWQRMPVRERLARRFRVWHFRQTLAHATAVAVQTETVRKRLLLQFPIASDNVYVVPNAVSLPSMQVPSQRWSELRQRFPEQRLLLCLSRYYSHKNLEILLEVARLIVAQNAPLRIVTTVGMSQGDAARRFIDNIKTMEIENGIVNIGPVEMADIPSLYQAVDGMILPTLLESFSGTYIEAMHYGVPIFTSDLDFAHDVCRDSAYYFDPMNPHEILARVQQAFADETDRLEHVQRGAALVRNMPAWPAVSRQIIDILTEIATQNIQNGHAPNHPKSQDRRH